MRLTEQQQAANELIEGAIRAAALAYGFGDDAEFVGDWLVVAEMPRLDGPPGETPYAVVWANGSLPPHRARGLVAVADDFLHMDDDDLEA